MKNFNTNDMKKIMRFISKNLSVIIIIIAIIAAHTIKAQKLDTIKFKNLKLKIEKTADYESLIELKKVISESSKGKHYISGASTMQLDSVSVVLIEKIKIAKEKKEDKSSVDTKSLNDTIIYNDVEIMPEFQKGEDAMYRFFAKKLKYPRAAKENGITGNVIITYVVEKDGSLTDVKCLKDIGGGCGAEGIRVVKLMPKWIPGKKNGVPVRVQFNMPIRFSLE